MSKKNAPPATELLDNPAIEDEFEMEESSYDSDSSGTPFDKSFNVLTCTSGDYLELMTRTTPQLAQAIGVGYNLLFNFRSRYIRGRLDTIMRLHVSMEGKGRAEMVQALQAGSGVPGEYFDQGNGTMHSFVDVGSDDDPDG